MWAAVDDPESLNAQRRRLCELHRGPDGLKLAVDMLLCMAQMDNEMLKENRERIENLEKAVASIKQGPPQ